MLCQGSFHVVPFEDFGCERAGGGGVHGANFRSDGRRSIAPLRNQERVYYRLGNTRRSSQDCTQARNLDA
ncbi:hypothetical protein GCM10027072_02770 [Streptomyces bullii]